MHKGDGDGTRVAGPGGELAEPASGERMASGSGSPTVLPLQGEQP